jgi:hypothetical protein
MATTTIVGMTMTTRMTMIIRTTMIAGTVTTHLVLH